MKRNYPPQRDKQAQSDEQQIITTRLDEIFSHSLRNQRQILIANKGYYIERRQHVRIDSIKGLPNELINFSPDCAYHFLSPFQALFCLEVGQLLIFLNGFPLSLSEAYHLLLKDENQFRNYRVFQQLNRTGFICLKPLNQPTINYNTSSSDLEPEDTETRSEAESDRQKIPIEPLFQIHTIKRPFKEILDTLKELGPKDAKLDATMISKQDSDGGTKIATSTVVFDVYKRENFAKNKPRKDKQGNPDYKVIVCDKSCEKPPNSQELMEHSGGSLIEGCGLVASEDGNACLDKLLFAVVDGDASICFSQFKPAQCLLNDANFIHTI